MSTGPQTTSRLSDNRQPIEQLTLPAPAKLNLFLHITGRRADGYHELQTLFQLLEFGDNLEFELSDRLLLEMEPPMEMPVEDNLVMRAARLLQSHVNLQPGARIRLHKRIPTGAGLGGGSSDAATTLIALNHLWQLKLGMDELAELGLKLGADVPLFVRGWSAFGSGVGEQLQALELPQRWYLVVTPQTHAATAEIFNHPQLTRNSTPIKMSPLAIGGGRNDCQSVAEKIYPEIAKTRKTLEKFAPTHMSGSGSSLFASFESEVEARRTLTSIQQEQLNLRACFISRGLNRSPALAALDALRAN